MKCETEKGILILQRIGQRKLRKVVVVLRCRSNKIYRHASSIELDGLLEDHLAVLF